MENIKDIVRKTLHELKKKSITVTPDNYFIEFYKQVKNAGIEYKQYNLFNEVLDEIANENTPEEEGDYSSFIFKLFERNEEQLKNLSVALREILAPSVNIEVYEQIDKLSEELSEHPSKLLDRTTISKMKSITEDRIANDRVVLKNKTSDILKLTHLLSKQFENTIVASTNSGDEFSRIKYELESLNISNTSVREMDVLQSQLINTLTNLELSIEEHKTCLLEEKSNFNELEEKFAKLQKELDSVQTEKYTDYLTGVLNRRAFDKELEKIEKKYQVFGSQYAVIFFDIDHFKNINDTYGHECGDVVLKAYAAILQKLTRQGDIIARYGGEEFVVLLNYSKEDEVTRYIKRVKEIIAKNDFIYKNNHLRLTFSAGVTFRKSYKSYTEVVTVADDLLYKAKNEGRDKVLIENGLSL